MSITKPWPFAAVGSILSVYAIYVEYKMEHKPEEEDFTALCDIEAIGASCSSAFALPEGKMLSYFGLVEEGSLLDLPNAVIGLPYYIYWLVLAPRLPKDLTFVISCLAMMSSIFLAYRLVVLKELCILCWSIHAINTRLLWSAFSETRLVIKSPILKTL